MGGKNFLSVFTGKFITKHDGIRTMNTSSTVLCILRHKTVGTGWGEGVSKCGPHSLELTTTTKLPNHTHVFCLHKTNLKQNVSYIQGPAEIPDDFAKQL